MTREAAQEWGSSAWRSAATDWVAGVLASRGIKPHGVLIERLNRAWSTVWSIDTNAGRYWFKENNAGHNKEAAVLSAVAKFAPEYVQQPLSVEPERGWMLTPDGGEALETAGRTDVEAWSLIVRRFAQLQRLSITKRAELLAAGAWHMPPERAAESARQQAEHLVALPVDDPASISKNRADKISQALPRLALAGEALASGPIPSALNQNDLAPRNVFVAEHPGGSIRFFDFADSTWTHPFTSLVIPVSNCHLLWGIPFKKDILSCREERIAAVIDAYLECWIDFAPMDELRKLARHAIQIGPLQRSTAWMRIIEHADPKWLPEIGGQPGGWLEDVTIPVEI